MLLSRLFFSQNEFLSSSELVKRTSLGKGGRSPERHILMYACRSVPSAAAISVLAQSCRSRCTTALEKLLHRMTYGQRVDLINQAYRMELPVFEAARQGDTLSRLKLYTTFAKQETLRCSSA